MILTNLTIILVSVGILLLVLWGFFKKKYLKIFGIITLLISIVLWIGILIFGFTEEDAQQKSQNPELSNPNIATNTITENEENENTETVKEFNLIFNNRNDLGIVQLHDKKAFGTSNNDYKIMTFGGNVSIIIDGTTYGLESVLKDQTITGEDIVNKAIKDSKNGGCTSEMYKDGGSMEYYYPEYTILKFNTVDGNRDLVIGKPGPIISQYQEQLKRKAGDESIFENTSIMGLTPISENKARQIWEEYKHNILLDTLEMYKFKSVTQGKVKPTNYFTSGSASNIKTANFERDAYIYYYCDGEDYERIIGYVDMYTGKVIGGEYSGI